MMMMQKSLRNSRPSIRICASLRVAERLICAIWHIPQFHPKNMPNIRPKCQNPYPSPDQNVKIYTQFQTITLKSMPNFTLKRLKDLTLCCRTNLYSSCKGVPRPPPPPYQNADVLRLCVFTQSVTYECFRHRRVHEVTYICSAKIV